MTRSEAKRIGLTHYNTGVPCSRGHVADRRTLNANCVDCNREDFERRRSCGLVAAYHKAHKAKNSEKYKEYQRNFRLRHRSRLKARMAQWEAENKQWRREWRKGRKDKDAARSKRFYSNNPGYGREKKANRKAASRRAMPSWVDRSEIKRIYAERPDGHHVDHIVPIVSDVVCGLHVPWNLQYLPATENLRKGNRLVA